MRSVIVGVLIVVARPAAAGPLECPEPAPAVRDAATGAPFAETFVLRNVGTGPVRMVGVDAGCSCVRRDLGRDSLEPGQSTELRVEVNTLQTPPGDHAWPIGVRYEHGGGSGRLELTLRARVRAEVLLQPASLAFSTAGAAEQTVRLIDLRPKPLRLLGARSSSSHVVVTAGPGNELRVAVSADAPEGDHAETVTLATDDPSRPELRLPVKVTKRPAGGVVATPDAVRLRFAAGQGALSTLVQLRSPAGLVAVEGAEASDPAVAVAWGKSTGPVASLRVKVTPGDRPAGTAEVRVRLKQPAGASAVIPVAWGGVAD